MAEAFTMFEKFGEVCAALEEADRKELIYALNMYGMFGQEVELPYFLRALFISLKDDIDYSKESRKRGSKGGRPPKAESGKPPVQSDSKPVVSDSDKPVVSEDEKPPVSEDAAKTESQNNTRQDSTRQNKGGRRFAPPTRNEVADFAKEYASQKGLDPGGFDAERFCDYYTANGWKVGRNPMRDWKATVRDWVRRDCKERGPRNEYSDL